MGFDKIILLKTKKNSYLSINLLPILLMNYEIVELVNFSGHKTTIYSVILGDDELTLYDYFIEENIEEYKKEIKSIVNRLAIIGNETGAREQFFKLNEGKPGDSVCALYDEPSNYLRLYCIRYGLCVIILGGGGPKFTRTWQEDPKLTLEASTLIEISNDIAQRIKDGEIKWSHNGTQLIGNLKFSDDEQ